jgi:hypothetical protein
MYLALALLLAVQDSVAPAPAPAPAPARAAIPADAYADSGSAAIVAAARERRDRNERLVTSYTALVTQRIGVGIRALRRDRMLFRQEMAARIEWHRDTTSRIEILGARQAVPLALRGVNVPEDLDAWSPFLAFDPAADYLRLVGRTDEGFLYPLADGAERNYRYRMGDTTRIQLPDGRVVRLVELRFEPRRSEFRLIAGSLWFDADSYGVVRAVFRPARPFDYDLDARDEDGDDVPGIVKPLRAEVRYVTIEYGLYEYRWWLPRFVAVDAEATAGNLMRVPVRFERVYTGIRAWGGTEPPAGVRRRGPYRVLGGAVPDSSLGARLASDTLAAIRRRCAAAADSLRRALTQREERGVRVEVRMGQGTCVRQAVWERVGRPDVEVVVPGDTQALLAHAALGEPILDMGDVISETELRQLGREIGALPEQPWQARARLPGGTWDVLRHTRYNRVEGLSPGSRAALDLGRLELEALARIGTADLVPNVELGLARPGVTMRTRLAAYHRLAAADPSVRPFGLINSLSGLLLGRDDGQYFRATGLELTGRPAGTGSRRYEWRLYAERQRPVGVETNASLPRLFDGDRLFPPNIVADVIEELGGTLRLRGERALAMQTRLGVELAVEGGAGDTEFARGDLTARFAAPIASRAVVGLEAAAGSSLGDVPVQSRFYLGGAPTLRGYNGGVRSGDAFWRARLEVANALPALRLALFSDAGWAGARGRFGTGRPLRSIGLGTSLLDGLFRIDLARALNSPTGWRVEFYVDGVL